MHLAKGLGFRAVAVMAYDDAIDPVPARIETVTDDSEIEMISNRGVRSLSALVIAAAVLWPLAVSAECGARDVAAQNTCKPVRAKALPAALRKYLAKSGCDVTAGSPYDEGYAIDLNADGSPEYAYCCDSAGHGPCGLKVFAQVSGQWTALSDGLYFPTPEDIPCDNFVALATKRSGYNDVCVGGDTPIKFVNGKYEE